MSTILGDNQGQESLDNRLYSMREALSAQIQLQKESTLKLSGDVSGLQVSMSGLFQKIDSLSSKLEASQKPNLALLGLIPAMLAGAWFVVNNAVANSIATSINPVAVRTAQIETSNVERDTKLSDLIKEQVQQGRDLSTLAQQMNVNNVNLTAAQSALNRLNETAAGSAIADGVSRTDRAALNDRVHMLETQLATGSSERKGEFSIVEAKLLEVEQQFKAVANIENIRWSDQLRLNAMTFERLHPGERYSTDTFSPSSIFQDGIGR